MEKSLHNRELGILELMAILNTPGPFSLLGIRNRALMAMAITSGLWGHEMWKLKCGDFDKSLGAIRTTRRILFDRKSGELLREYLEKARPQLVKGKSGDHVFLARTGDTAMTSTYSDALWHACRKAGLRHISWPELCGLWREGDRTAEAILNAPSSESKRDLRNRAILSLRVISGILPADLMRLRLNDLNLAAGEICFTKVVMLDEIWAQRLATYLEQSRPRLVKNYRHETLFVSISGLPLNSTMGGIILKGICRDAGIKRTTFTSLRKAWREMNDSTKAELKEDDHFSRITFQ